MAKIVIAPCADSAVLAALHHETITVAYRGYFPDSQPPALAELRDTWTTRLADPTATALLASYDGQPVGSVMARADPRFGEGQILGLHVLPSHWGQRIGSALHDAALATLSREGYRAAGLWVIAANQRARRMYEGRGWDLCPGVEEAVHGVLEVRYHRELVSEPSRPEVRSPGKGQPVSDLRPLADRLTAATRMTVKQATHAMRQGLLRLLGTQ